MESKEKTREEIMAEREARKKAKLAKKKPKQSGIVTNDVDKNVHNSIDSTSKKPQTVTDCASPSSLLLNSILKTAMDGTSKKRQSVTDCAASPRPAVKSVFNVTDSTSKKSQSATSCAKPPAPLGISNSRQTVTDCAPAPRVNDQLDGCLPKRSFFEPMVKEMKMLSNDLMAKAVISDEKSVVKHPASSPTIQEVSLVLAPHDVNKVEPVKSKAELKAERRAKQEAQRAAKAGIKTAPTKTAPAKSSPKPTEVKPAKSAIKKTSTKTESEGKSKSVTFAGSSTKQASQSRIKLFSHLYRDRNINFKSILNSSDLHPEVVGLGIQYSNRIIVGSNARCVAFLHVLKKMLSDYKTPAEKEFSRGFESKLEPTVNFLNQCRPISVSMTNALKHIKWHLTQLPNNITDAEARLKMSNVITMYIKEQIEVAGEAISLFVRKKIANGDVILTFGCSSLVERILKDAQAAGVDFSVVIIDSAPWFEGKELLRRLTKAKIPCTYVLISAASYIMKQASKVLLGAHALLANGCVMSRSGTALVALLANTANVPVLVCCETHKFSERVQTDAFVYNELGDPNELVTNTSPLFGWESNTYLVPLSLVYDVTPPDLVTAVVTELAILPCTSVPVVLRVKPTESA